MPAPPRTRRPARDQAVWTRAAAQVWTLVGAVALACVAWRIAGPFIGAAAGPVTIAAVVAYLADPSVGWLVARTPLRRPAATLVVGVVGLAGLVAIAATTVPVLLGQAGRLAQAAPQIATDIAARATAWAGEVGLPLTLPDIDQAGLSGTTVSAVVGTAIGAAAATMSVVVTGLTGILTGLYLCADLPRLRAACTAGLAATVGPERASDVSYVAGRASTAIGGWLRGQLVIAGFVGIMSTAALAVVGVPFWAVLGVVSGVANLIPMVGPIAAAVAAAAVAAAVGDGPDQAAWAIVAMLVVQQVDAHVITPRVLARTVAVPAAVLLPTLAAAAATYGLAGLVLSVPAVGAALAAFRAVADLRAGPDAAPAPDAGARLAVGPGDETGDTGPA